VKIRAVLFFALALAALAPHAVDARSTTLAQRIEAERKKADALHAKLHQKKAELSAATVRVQGLQTSLDQTNTAISSVQARIGGLAAQERSTQRRMDWNTVQLRAAQASFKLHDDALRRRLVDIYENGDLTYASVLLSARSFSEFVERWQDLQLLIDANESAVRTRKAAESRVASVEADLQRTQMELNQQQSDQEHAENQLAVLADERRNLVAVADQERRHVAGEVAQIEDLTANEEAQLESMIQERERELQAERKAQGIAGEAPSSSGGAFHWPVSGTITSPFGWRSNPFGGAPEFHQGLDIAAPTGTTLTAAAGGTVLLAQWYGGYGNYILIDDGNGFSTGYGHLSAIYVSVGQQIKQGQAIGAVGCTGECTGPHVHFEIRINGKPVDPATRLH
jgi:murein DD-endopeptidase MepM/ murein hydrolase activator NlpD